MSNETIHASEADGYLGCSSQIANIVKSKSLDYTWAYDYCAAAADKTELPDIDGLPDRFKRFCEKWEKFVAENPSIVKMDLQWKDFTTAAWRANTTTIHIVAPVENGERRRFAVWADIAAIAFFETTNQSQVTIWFWTVHKMVSFDFNRNDERLYGRKTTMMSRLSQKEYPELGHARVTRNCVRCTNRRNCAPYNTAAGDYTLMLDDSNSGYDVDNTEAELSAALDHLTILTDRVEWLKSRIIDESEHGVVHSEFKVDTPTKKRWKPGAPLKTIEKDTGVKIVNKPKLTTPAQVIDQGVPNYVIADHVEEVPCEKKTVRRR